MCSTRFSYPKVATPPESSDPPKLVIKNAVKYESNKGR